MFHCLGCGTELEPVINYLNVAAGGVYCPRCGESAPANEPIEPEDFKILRHLQRSSWGQVRNLELRPETLARAENVLYRYLVNVLERRLRSVDFVRRLQVMRTAVQA